MCGQLRHNMKHHAQLPTDFLGMDAWMTSQLILALMRKLRGSLMCLGYFFPLHVIHGCLYNQALADVKATSAGIKCLYCRKIIISPKKMLFVSCNRTLTNYNSEKSLHLSFFFAFPTPNQHKTCIKHTFLQKELSKKDFFG